ncbi:MAG: DNA polymerase III subunit alpha [Candidatus Gastranaerophilales bacterium]|nr:DNA polymerase III subunit alpha [Candidatus Gastranaerophilales bacterium]
MQFVPLHLHTEYSLLDGAIKLKELVKYCAENDMPACAITDHGVMYGAIEFYKLAKSNNVKPILGCEFYVHPGDIHEKDQNNNPRYHLVLLAKNLQGYKNLIKLVSISHLEGMYYKPRINHDLIKENSEGLIRLSACLGGELNSYVTNGQVEKAKEIAQWYKDLFGDDYYIELQDHGLPEQKKNNPIIINIAKELGIELVITNDSHYLKRENAKAQDILLCLQTQKDYDDPKRMRMSGGPEYYVKTGDEMREAFSWMDDNLFNKCLENNLKIADKCNLIMELGKTLLPNYPVPKGYTIETYLHKLVQDGMKKRYGEITKELDERCKYELGVIERMGFSAYFLIVWDYINFSKTHNIPVGPGRGSAAGSLISYVLGITEIDPMKHNLMFERFLNPDRVSMPDVDVDFCIAKRGDVIKYVTEKYGEDKVCQIITFGTYAAKAAVKAVARVLKLDFTTSNNLTKMMVTGPKTYIDDSLKEGMPLREQYDSDPKIKEIIDIAKSIEGLTCNTGTHAAGVIIAKDPLIDSVPLQYAKDEKNIVVTYPMANIDDVGLLKMDFLGLKNLTIIQSACDMIKERHGVELDMDHLPLDDKAIYEMLQKGETNGIFQIESTGMKQMVTSMHASVFEDISAVLALYRPGPIEAKYPELFVNRKLGKEPITYEHPLLESILKDTYGTMVYQEQIMKIVQVLADFTMGEADKLRKAMGKKKVEIMEEYRPKFLDGAEKKGVDRQKANDLYDNMTKFAQYCFNRAHTVCYAYITYETAFLKVHYPVEYFSALLTGVNTDQEKTQSYIAESLKYGIKVLPPDINLSRAGFYPDGDNIRFGLASVKSVGENFLEDVDKEREKGCFEDMFDFCKRVRSCNKRTLESLVKVGAFAFTGKSRKQLFENIDYIMSRADEEVKREASGQLDIFGAMSAEPQKVDLIGSEEEFSDSEIQAFEKELLGFYVTSHPLSSIVQHLPFLTTHSISELPELNNNDPVTICGLLSSVRSMMTKEKIDAKGNTKPGTPYKMGTIEDLSGSVDFFLFSKKMEEYSQFVQQEAKVIISGKISKSEDEENPSVRVFIDSVRPVENTNIVKVNIKEDMNYENIIALRETILKYKGSDPVIFNVKGKRILANPALWVNVTNDFLDDIKKNFGNDIDINANSLDAASV